MTFLVLHHASSRVFPLGKKQTGSPTRECRDTLRYKSRPATRRVPGSYCGRASSAPQDPEIGDLVSTGVIRCAHLPLS